MTANSERTYLPAAGRDFFLPLYDPLTKLLGADRMRRALIEQAELGAHDAVLDIGCGTGTMAILIKQLNPGVNVIGLDPDPRALARAERKAFRAGTPVRFDQGFADLLMYRDASFDRVFSSLMFHHLDADTKLPTMREVRRVLKPGGRLEFADFDGSHWHHRLEDNSETHIVELMAQGGFTDVKRTASMRLLFGRVAFYQAR
jgi:ubiquinone/menaquinone biosynthesis C-methylase UbiE